MKKCFYYILAFIVMACSIQAQEKNNKSLMKPDSMKRDNTKLIQEKNIRDTTQFMPGNNSDTSKIKSKMTIKGEKTMYLVPDSPNKKLNNNSN